MPTVWSYVRFSTLEQQNGLSEELQSQRIKEYVAYRFANEIREQSVNVAPEAFFDPGVSAWKVPLVSRPAAKEMLACVRPGDHIVCFRIDRVFRNVRDFSNMLDFFDREKISLHFCDGMQLDLSTANGRMMAQMMVMTAEWESSMKSERIKAALAAKKARGQLVRVRGMRMVKRHNGKRMVAEFRISYEDLRIIEQIKDLRDNHGLSFNKISDIIEQERCERFGLEYQPVSAWAPRREWDKERVRRNYRDYDVTMQRLKEIAEHNSANSGASQ